VLLLQHPRTRALLEADASLALLSAAGVRCVGPLPCVESLSLLRGAGAIVTDAAGVQEDASVLGVPCFTLQDSTARTVTLTRGTNVLLGDDPAGLADVRPARRPPSACAIPLWDGRAAERVADVLVANYTLVAQAGPR
jgi:UDP-N-acetylglucosamine 2-epimerase (non-hydrolysing)